MSTPTDGRTISTRRSNVCAIATAMTSRERGKVYKVAFQPMTTSNYFEAGHRIRIEVSSSNFPRFDRNLNTGGKNYDESKGVIAHNAVHHSKQYPSEIKITVVKKPATPSTPQ